MAFSNKNLTAYARSTNPRYQNGGPVDPNYREPTETEKAVAEWTKAYINSPKYKKRLSNFYKYPDFVQRQRTNTVDSIKFNNADIGLRYWGNDNSLTASPLSLKTEQMNNPKAPKQQTIDEIVAHEFAHSLNANKETPGSSLNSLEQSFIINKNKNITPDRLKTVTTAEPNRFSGEQTLPSDVLTGAEHDLAPTETMSDINAFRYLLKKNKLYDAGTQDFNTDLLKQAKEHKNIKEAQTFKRLQQNFNDDSIIEIMNKVALNESALNSDIGMAAFGGIIGDSIMKRPKKFATGGMTGWNAAASAIPAVGGLIEALVSKPSYTAQPVMNAQAIHNMSDPYDNPGLHFAEGGEVGDIDDNQYLQWLTEMFDNTAESESNIYATGGWIKKAINPKHKGYCTPMTKSTCTPRRKALAKRFKSGDLSHHAMGGEAVPIEVEDEEIVETPDGNMQQMSGPTHEEGGIPMVVPEGTKIYSDRLNIGGKTMQERKAARERSLSKLNKLLTSNPTDIPIKNTVKAMKGHIDLEDEQDMALQKAANDIYSQRKPGKFALGGIEDGDPIIPFREGYMDVGNTLSTANPMVAPSTALVNPIPTIPTRSTPTPEEDYRSATGLTTGDYIGLGANIFGAVAPLLNTRNNAANRMPNVNRYLGFGREAIEANDQAQGLVSSAAANARRNLNTSTATSIARNRNSAMGINTLRALDTLTDISRNRTNADIDMGANQQLIQLLNQRGQLTNQRDQIEAAGATQRDEREAQDIDNYYSNIAENLSNFATQIGNVGRNLNINKSNKDNTALLESMSEYFDFGRDKNGKLVLTKKRS